MKKELIKEELAALFFPRRCPVCRSTLAAGSLICDGCEDSFDFIGAPFCAKCGKSVLGVREDGLCSDCAEKIRLFESCRCLMSYNDPARELMYDIKYNCGKEFIRYLGRATAERLGDWILSAGVQCLVPVPIHRKKRRIRGYNQAEELAFAVGRELGIAVRPEWLVRRVNTKAQKELDADARLLNLQNAFSAGSGIEEGASVMIVDDIYTTGATMEACTETLLNAGAGRIYGLCVCAGEDVYDSADRERSGI